MTDLLPTKLALRSLRRQTTLEVPQALLLRQQLLPLLVDLPLHLELDLAELSTTSASVIYDYESNDIPSLPRGGAAPP